MAKKTTPDAFFFTGDTMHQNSPSYIPREADDDLLKEILAGQYCYVLTPRQMGKSSLMVHTAKRLRAKNVKTVIIDLQGVGTSNITFDQWCQTLLDVVEDDLNLSITPQEWWQAHPSLSPVRHFTTYIRDVVLVEVKAQIVIFIDEIDFTLKLDFRDDFFAAIRNMYNARATTSIFKQLTFVLMGVVSPSDLIKDPAISPFNIGKRIELQEFSPSQAIVLQTGLDQFHPDQGKIIFHHIYAWTNGHPYLTQKLCYVAASTDNGDWRKSKVDDLIKQQFHSPEKSEEDHLKKKKKQILDHNRRRQLLQLYKKVYQRKTVKDKKESPLHNQLKLSGLVKAKDGHLQVRNQIYRQVFDLAWVKANTAINWTRIVAGIFIFATLLLVGYIGHNAWVDSQVDDSELKFHQTTNPQKRAEHLANIFEPPGLFQVTDYDYRARDLFYSLSSGEEQVALFKASYLDDTTRVTLVKGLYTTLADTDDSNNTWPLLQAMVDALNKIDETDETNKLKAELNSWFEGRNLAQDNQYDEALAAYTKAISLNPDNPATLYERAKLFIELQQYKEALTDLDQVIVLAGQLPDPTSTPTVPSIAITTTLTASPSPTDTPTASPTLSLTDTATPISTATPNPNKTPSPTDIATSIPMPTPTNTPPPPSTPRPVPVLVRSEFGTVGGIINAVRNLLDNNPDLARELFNSSSSYSNLEVFGLLLPFSPSLENETLIVIATFHSSEGVVDVETHHKIQRAIQEAAAELGLENLRVEVDSSQLRAEAKDEAQALGEQYKASMVIWGADTGVRVTANFLNLKDLDFAASEVKINETERTQIANPEAYINFIIEDLPGQLTFLSLFAIGQTYHSQADYEDAISVIERAVTALSFTVTPPTGADAAYFLLGRLYQTQSPPVFEQATLNYTTAIDLNPDYTDAYNNRGLIYNEQGKYDLALADYNTAIDLNPDYTTAYVLRGNTYYEQGEYDLALADCNTAIDLNPDDARIYILRGLTYNEQGEYDLAIQDLERYLELEPNSDQREAILYFIEQLKAKLKEE